MKITAILLFHIIISVTCFSQSTLPKKDIVDVWNEMIACKEDKYIINNIELIYEKGCDDSLSKIFGTYPVINAEIVIGDYYKPNINTSNLIPGFVGNPVSFWLENVTFKKNFFFAAGPAFASLYFRNCTFEQEVNIITKDSGFDLSIYDSKLQSTFFFDLSGSEKSNITLGYNEFELKRCGVNCLSSIYGNSATKLKIEKCYFRSHANDSSLIEIENIFYSIEIDSCMFKDDISFNKTNVTNTFSIKNTEFRNVSMEDFVPPPAGGVSVAWQQLASHLCLLSTHQAPTDSNSQFWVVQKSPVYEGESMDDFGDYPRYEKLTASFYNLLRIYKERGDLESANACYIDVKDIQTKRLGYLYEKYPSVSNFFLWKTNQFLRYFCDYGTNPAKSVVVSFYVILIFGAFYFFFYSAWDRINKSYFVNRYMSLSKYLSSKTTLGELYQNTKSREINSYAEFKSELKLKKKEVPGYYTFLGHVLYRFVTSRFGITLWIIKRLDLHKNHWNELKSGKKFMVGTIIGISILVFGIYTIFIKSLSAIMLSLNAFSTLGFGNIPVKGLSKYLTVIEGFIGWLLLSIFSVSLIAQMIQ